MACCCGNPPANCSDCPYYGCSSGSRFATMSRTGTKYLTATVTCDSVTGTTSFGSVVSPAISKTFSFAFSSSSCQHNGSLVLGTSGLPCFTSPGYVDPSCFGKLRLDLFSSLATGFSVNTKNCTFFWRNNLNDQSLIGYYSGPNIVAFVVDGVTVPADPLFEFGCIDSIIGQSLSFYPYGTSLNRCVLNSTTTISGSLSSFPQAKITFTDWTDLP
jgi:hypothetical protein